MKEHLILRVTTYRIQNISVNHESDGHYCCFFCFLFFGTDFSNHSFQSDRCKHNHTAKKEKMKNRFIVCGCVRVLFLFFFGLCSFFLFCFFLVCFFHFFYFCFICLFWIFFFFFCCCCCFFWCCFFSVHFLVFVFVFFVTPTNYPSSVLTDYYSHAT